MKITKEILEQGRWSDDTYSDPQLRIFGFTEDKCEGWQEQILGDEEPMWKIKLFWGLKEWVYVEKRVFKANGKLKKLRHIRMGKNINRGVKFYRYGSKPSYSPLFAVNEVDCGGPYPSRQHLSQ